MTDKQTDRQAERQKDIQTNTPTERRTGIQTNHSQNILNAVHWSVKKYLFHIKAAVHCNVRYLVYRERICSAE